MTNAGKGACAGGEAVTGIFADANISHSMQHLVLFLRLEVCPGLSFPVQFQTVNYTVRSKHSIG